ncbi:type I restriction enzyme endonuclease domain-containing protein [Methanomethylovorans sp.]|uniref:type I restriction enzyme endonuclease domain-containing protein n=1 Tax=Methanomethylovorans sp. TaxID=2758717 RepID=UPI00351C5C3B
MAQGKNGSNGANFGFEEKMWQTADKLRNNMDAAEYKHVVLGLIFLKYISDAFEEKHAELAGDNYSDAEDPDEYLAENIFWVPPEARWTYIEKSAKLPEIGKIVDDAMSAIEKDNQTLKGVLAKKIRDSDKHDEDLGLSAEEIAFYDALAANNSAVDVLGDETLRLMAVELVGLIRNNATIDWTVRKNIQAKMRVSVKKLLKKYGYPSDMQLLATKNILEQAEMMCRDIAMVA